MLVYLTGHGGDEFLKFQDSEEISSQDFADAVEQMRIQKRYNELLFMADTCQAFTLGNSFYSEDVIAMGSSLKDQNSYSHWTDAGLGVSLMDRFSHAVGAFIAQHAQDSETRLHMLFDHLLESTALLGSNVGIRSDLFKNRPIRDVKLMDFFGSVKRTHVLRATRAVEPTTVGGVVEPPLPQPGEARSCGVGPKAFANPAHRAQLGAQAIPLSQGFLVGLASLGVGVALVSWRGG